LPEHPADAPRAARLAGRRIRRPRLVAQGDAPADRPVERLSDVVVPRRGGPGPRSRKRPLLALRPTAPVGGGGPRLGPGRERQPEPEHGRDERLPAYLRRGAGRAVAARPGLAAVVAPGTGAPQRLRPRQAVAGRSD